MGSSFGLICTRFVNTNLSFKFGVFFNEIGIDGDLLFEFSFSFVCLHFAENCFDWSAQLLCWRSNGCSWVCLLFFTLALDSLAFRNELATLQIVMLLYMIDFLANLHEIQF